jgi:hypothetical protein
MLHAIQHQSSQKCSTQNDLLLNKLIEFYSQDDFESVRKMLAVINGESAISLRIIDWFSTNYAKKYYTVYTIGAIGGDRPERRFKVYTDYKLKLKAYSKKRFDPFCRWDRINFPYKNGSSIQTTIGQLNFFKWAIENGVIRYIESNYATIENDMNARNSISKRKTVSISDSTTGAGTDISDTASTTTTTTRKKREELSILASSCIKKETVEVVVKFE